MAATVRRLGTKVPGGCGPWAAHAIPLPGRGWGHDPPPRRARALLAHPRALVRRVAAGGGLVVLPLAPPRGADRARGRRDSGMARARAPGRPARAVGPAPARSARAVGSPPAGHPPRG